MRIKPPLSTAIVSVICGVLTFCVYSLFNPSFNPSLFPGLNFSTNKGCIVLTADESSDDSAIRLALNSLGYGEFISESSQMIAVDDFGRMRMISLESYNHYIEPFDPRNSGYADRLKSFFVNNGRRFFFLPLDDVSGIRADKLSRKLVPLLGEIPFEIGVMGEQTYMNLILVLYAAACAITLYLSRSRRLFACELPVLLAFGFFGSGIFIYTAVLAAMWELLREPLNEIYIARCSERWRYDYAGEGFSGIYERMRPFILNVAFLSFLLVFLLFYSVISELPLIPLLFGTSCFFLLCFLAYNDEAKLIQENRHIPFTPVLMLPVRGKTFSFFPLLLPFWSVSLIAVFFPVFMPGFLSRNDEYLKALEGLEIIRDEEYYRHMEYQYYFSYRPLWQEPAVNENGAAGYYNYILGGDGLISGSSDYIMGEAEIPLFPLEKLTGFLLEYYNINESLIIPAGQPLWFKPVSVLKGWITVALIITLCFVDIIRPGLLFKRRFPIYGNKRIAA